MKKILIVLNVLTLLLLTTGVTQAQTLLLNLGAQSLSNWNSIAALNGDLSSGGVTNNTGAVWTGLAITTDNFSSSVTNSGTYPSVGTVPSWMVSGAETTAWIRSGGTGPSTIVFSGLSTGFTYQLDLVSARSSSNTNQGLFTVNGTASNTGNSTAFKGYQDGWVDGVVMSWNGIVATGGLITLNLNGIDSSNTAYANALQLTATAVPEPSTGILFGAGLLGIWFLRRKYSASTK